MGGGSGRRDRALEPPPMCPLPHGAASALSSLSPDTGFKHLQIPCFKHLLKAACPGSSHASSCMYHPVPRAGECPKQRSATILQCPPEQGATRIRPFRDIYSPDTLG